MHLIDGDKRKWFQIIEKSSETFSQDENEWPSVFLGRRVYKSRGQDPVVMVTRIQDKRFSVYEEGHFSSATWHETPGAAWETFAGDHKIPKTVSGKEIFHLNELQQDGSWMWGCC